MSDAKPDKPKKSMNKEKNNATLSLKGAIDPQSLKKTNSSGSGLVVELRQKKRNGPNSNRHKNNNNSRSGVLLQGNVNSITLSKAEQDARNRALDIAKKFKEEEEKK